MKDVSIGNAAPKNRSINVDANLLGEWIAEQAKLRRAIVRYLAILGGTLVAGAVVVPTLWRATATASNQAHALQRGVAELDSQLSASDQAAKEAQPSIVVTAMCERTRRSFGRLAQELNVILRAGGSRTMLTGLRTEVQAGEIHLVAQAMAEDDGAADDFALRAGDDKAKVAGIVTSRPSAQLGLRGLSFEYVKRIGVDQ